MRTIILADNQDISKAGWFYLLRDYAEKQLIYEALDKKELLSYLAQYPESVVVLDYALFDFDSVNELIILQERFKDADWIVFSDELSDDFCRTLLFNTCSFGVIMKDCTFDEIKSAIREANKRNRYICNHVSNVLLKGTKNSYQPKIKSILTVTEQEILKEMAFGKTTKEIAAKRHASVHTIMTHRKNIFRKIDVNNVHEATKYAFRAGIVDMAEYSI
ncbi:MAG TPA: response regulator transcription factor [Paludibacter sp.]|nr:response regulator transcription factor [Paludibacter sp.]